MMKKKTEKTFYVVATQLTPIDNEFHIPTAICYDGEKIIGTKAIKKTFEEKYVNKNFKVQLGEYNAGKLKDENQTFYCEDGKERTSFELTKDFFDEVLTRIEGQEKIPKYEKTGLKVMVAEPLSLHMEKSDSTWIKNYRDNILRILNHYDSVEFLPEPFAVYQYYRYGLRIPQVADDSKNIAFIVDFGGGTFDVSIIETVHSGDISQGTKNSKPHAASSIAIGGFYINQKISEYLIKRTVGDNDVKKVNTFIDTFNRYKKNQLDLMSLNSEKQAFIKNMSRLIESVEYPKIELCQKISKWDLTNKDCYDKVEVNVPVNPFLATTSLKSTVLHGHELRKLFRNDIWEPHLKKTIKSVFKRAEEKLKGRQISVTLISGGSSNIRWLQELLVHEFSNELKSARPIPLSESFQEIVAKGLAIECARRKYNPDSEFVSVTYNPIKLLLNSDDRGIEEKHFQSVENKIDMDGAPVGVLMPSAQALHNFIDDPLQWKFKLNHPPRRSLKYYFLRPSQMELQEQPNDIDAIYNLDSEVFTPKNSQFEGKIRIELTFKKDGTVIPRFIYKSSSEYCSTTECSVTGKPFVVDMTSDITRNEFERYIGFDFGTSNSSICYLTNSDVEVFETKGKDSSWLELKELIPYLPYPIAYSIKKYLSCSMTDPNQAVNSSRQAFESMLAFAAYVAVSEASTKISIRDIFKGYTQRSMGPLKNLIDISLQKLKKTATFSAPFQKIFGDYLEDINQAIGQLNDNKHDSRSSANVDIHKQLICLANICKEAMDGKIFGYVEHLEPHKFRRGEYEGTIRVSTESQPFVEALKFSCSYSFLKNEPLIIDCKSGSTLSLYPLYFIEDSVETTSGVKIYLFDKQEQGTCKYKPVDEETRIDCEESIFEAIKNMKENQEYMMPLCSIKLSETE